MTSQYSKKDHCLIGLRRSSNLPCMNAVLLLMFAYGGFDAALIPAGEVKNPARDAPVVLMAALVIVTTVYWLATRTTLS